MIWKEKEIVEITQKSVKFNDRKFLQKNHEPLVSENFQCILDAKFVKLIEK